MLFQRQAELIERKRRLGWTNREVANALGVSPAVASAKLNGFCVFTAEDRRILTTAFIGAEQPLTETEGVSHE